MELLKQIEQEGEQEAQQVLAAAEAQASALRQQAEGELQAWTEEYRRSELHRMEQEKRLIVSRARAKARAIILQAKSRAAERLFEKLFQEAGSLRADPVHYKTFLERCLRETEREISGPLVLLIDAADEKAVSELLKGGQHKIGEKIKTSGGFIVTNLKGDLVVDNRLETRIANLRQRYRPALGQALFDRAKRN